MTNPIELRALCERIVKHDETTSMREKRIAAYSDDEVTLARALLQRLEREKAPKGFMRNAEGRIAYGWSKQGEEGGFHVEAWAPNWMTVTYLAHGWFIPYEKVNELQASSIAKTIDTAKAAHYTDLTIRINGEYKRFEADWVKHLVYVQPLSAVEAK